MQRRFGVIFFLVIGVLYRVSVWADTPPLFETQYYTQEKALIKLLSVAPSPNILLITPEVSDAMAKSVRLKPDGQQILYFRTSDAIVFELDELGKHYPITLMVKVVEPGKIDGALVRVYREHVGEGVRKNRFLTQFKGKTLSDPIRVDGDIDGITGATISSWSVATAVKKALFYYQWINTH